MGNQGSLGWFGKLPCVGDFCSHGISTALEHTLDCTLSTVMQLATNNYPEHWQQAYFNAPVHGFVWNRTATHREPADRCVTLGVLMPSVDRASRAFPFVLMEQFERQHLAQHLSFVQTWMDKALQIASSALDEEWPLERLRACRIQTDQEFDPGDTMSWPEAGMCNWYRLDQLTQPHWHAVLACHGFSQPQALLPLWGLEST